MAIASISEGSDNKGGPIKVR